jgi:membrane fusion protein (multidrug efflux system)
VLAALGGALAVDLRYYREARTRHPDVAVIEGRVVEISPKIAGRVQRVAVALDQTVKAGQLLVELELSYTKVYAPEAGRVTRRRVEEGADVQAGQPLLTLVPDDLWVLASFKESRLRDIRPGQPVTIRVDAYPGSVFRGRVDAVGPGAVLPDVGGSRLAGMGQRVPVKILFVEKPDPKFPLAPGMPVATEISAR